MSHVIQIRNLIRQKKFDDIKNAITSGLLDVSIEYSDRVTIFDLAVSWGCLELIEFLLTRPGSDINEYYSRRSTSSTPLIIATNEVPY